MLIAFLSTRSVSFQRLHCPSQCSSRSFPTSLLYNNSNILFTTLRALIVLFSAYCHPYHGSRSPPLPTRKNPVAFPMPLSSLPVLPSSFCMLTIILVILHTCCHPHCSSSLGERMNVFLSKALPSLLVFPVVLPKASCSPPCPNASLSSFWLSLVGQKAISTTTITPQHPCCPHGSWNNKKNTKSETPGPTLSLFVYPRCLQKH